MVVMAGLRQAHLGLEPQNLLAIFAHLAVHVVGAFKDLAHPLNHRVDHQIMVIEIIGLDECDVRVFRRHLIGMAEDPLHQHAGEQEIREDDNALVAKLRDMLERRFDERERHTGIGGFAPAKAHAFPEHPHDFRDVGIGVGVRRSAPNNDQHRVMKAFALGPAGRLQPFLDAGRSGADHPQIDPQLAAIVNGHVRVHRLIGVQYRGDVILGVTGCKQHAGHRQNVVHALRLQRVQSLVQNRIGKFQIAVIHRHFWKALTQPLGKTGELINGIFVAAAMTADHHAVALAIRHIVEHGQPQLLRRATNQVAPAITTRANKAAKAASCEWPSSS